MSEDPNTCSYAGSSTQELAPNLNSVDFVDPYFTTLVTAAAADEGGNFVQIYPTPLGLTGDYHLNGGSPAENPPGGGGIGGLLGFDVDRDPRRVAEGGDGDPDTGADEVFP